MSADRCSGHCCRDFSLRLSPGDLLRNFETALGMSGGPDGDQLIAEIEIIAPMVIPLGPASAEGGWRYTCRHLLPVGDCAIYARRPRMCRAYPYGLPCPHAECTWWLASGRAPLVTEAVT